MVDFFDRCFVFFDTIAKTTALLIIPTTTPHNTNITIVKILTSLLSFLSLLPISIVLIIKLVALILEATPVTLDETLQLEKPQGTSLDSHLQSLS